MLLTSCVWGCVDEPLTLSTAFLRPAAGMRGTPADYGAAYDEYAVPVAPGRAVSIWHAKAGNARAVVVIVPGSDENKSRYLVALPVFIPCGYDVVLMDYEGFGNSTGGPLKLERLVDDAVAVADFARTLHPRVVLFGISTGAPVATYVAAEQEFDALILEAPLILDREVSLWLEAAGVDHVGLTNLASDWVRPQVPASFDILKYIQYVQEPKLIMQSSEDEVVPPASGRLVYDRAPEPRQFVELVGPHGKMVEQHREQYAQQIASWLDRTLGT